MGEAFAPAYADIADLAAAYRSGRTTPLAVAEASLHRLELLEPQLNAVIDPMREAALQAAALASRELQAGLDRGPLHGIPVAIKDLIDVAGVPTTYGTRAVDPVLPKADAVLTRHLREAGAVPLAKTNLLEFAYGVAHPAVGQTNNPWNPSRTAGGSSGGSAALVAAGIVPVAVGTDTGGSIRIPAAYCGIVGLKPSYGLVSTEGVFPLSWSLDHAGPLARSVRGAAALLSGLTGQAIAVSEISPARLRIGLVRPHLDSPLVTPGVREAIGIALDRLARHGMTLEPVDIAGLGQVTPALLAILSPEAALAHEGLAAWPEHYAPGTRAQIEAGRAALGIDYVRAQRFRDRLARAVEACFDRVDLIVSPAVAFVAPAEDPMIEGDGGEGEMLSSGLANLTGHPAITLPCGFSEGLPVGLQLIGSAGRDSALLSGAAAVEACLAFAGRPMP